MTLSTCVHAEGDERIQVIGVLKDAALDEKVTVTGVRKPPVNKWLLLQVLVGIITAAAIAATILRHIRARREV